MLGPLAWLIAGALAGPADSAAVQARMDSDVAAGRPLVVHVVVALADNQHQNIVPVKASLGNGQDPKNNLYWGALYGVATHLTKPAVGFLRVPAKGALPAGVLDRLVMRKRLMRKGRRVWIYLVAEAWDGARIEDATARFLRLSAGLDRESLAVSGKAGPDAIQAGGAANLVVYVGHDGLMDFAAPVRPESVAGEPVRAAAVFACASGDYFADLLAHAGAHRLVMTTGLMAPEAYLLEALVETWGAGGDPAAVREAVAQAYRRYQKCSLKAARALFSGDS